MYDEHDCCFFSGNYEKSRKYGDMAYNVYAFEDELEQADIAFNPVRKTGYDSFIEDGIKLIRKRIELVLSIIR